MQKDRFLIGIWLIWLVLMGGCRAATTEPELPTLPAQALSTETPTAQAYNDEGWWTHYYEGDYDQAIAAFSRAVELDPNFAPAYYNRGWMYALKGEQARAVADYQRAATLLRA